MADGECWRLRKKCTSMLGLSAASSFLARARWVVLASVLHVARLRLRIAATAIPACGRVQRAT